jgi:hypothetical protein
MARPFVCRSLPPPAAPGLHRLLPPADAAAFTARPGPRGGGGGVPLAAAGRGAGRHGQPAAAEEEEHGRGGRPRAAAGGAASPPPAALRRAARAAQAARARPVQRAPGPPPGAARRARLLQAAADAGRAAARSARCPTSRLLIALQRLAVLGDMHHQWLCTAAVHGAPLPPPPTEPPPMGSCARGAIIGAAHRRRRCRARAHRSRVERLGSAAAQRRRSVEAPAADPPARRADRGGGWGGVPHRPRSRRIAPGRGSGPHARARGGLILRSALTPRSCPATPLVLEGGTGVLPALAPLPPPPLDMLRRGPAIALFLCASLPDSSPR